MKIVRLYCDIPGCKKTFRDQEGLDEHLDTDHASYNSAASLEFKCPQCGKALSTKQSLKEHLYTHTGEKPYKCLEAGCGLLFRQSSQLSNHKKVHQEIKKSVPENSRINLSQLSKLFSIEKSYIYSIPTGPFTVLDAVLPPLKVRSIS